MSQISTIPVVGTFAFERHGNELFKVMTIEPMNDISEDLKTRLDRIAYHVFAKPEELHTIVRQAKLQGICMTTEIRQLASRGIPIYQALSSKIGVPVAELNAAAEQRLIRFLDLEMAIIRMTDTGSIFGPA